MVELETDPVDMANLDDLAKQVRENEKANSRLDRKVAYLEGLLNSHKPEKKTHPVVVVLIGVAATAFVGFQGWMGVTSYQHGNSLASIKQSLLGLGLTTAANTPSEPTSQAQAQAALAEARRTSAKLPETVIKQAGQSFIEAAAWEPTAWPVALDFLNYRSSLNPIPPRPFSQVAVGPAETDYSINTVPGKPEPRMMYLGLVPQDQAARIEPLDAPRKQTTEQGIAFLRPAGGAMNLDGIYLRHVVLDGVEVHYSGGPVALEDVLFLNCTFILDNSERGRELGRQVLTQANVTYRAVG